MKKERINAWQLFCLIVLFAFGTALVVSYGAEAGRDAWLAIFMGGSVGGTVIFFIYGSLYKLFPTLSLISYSQKIVGRWIGGLLGLVFILYFLHGSARVLRDYGDLISASMFTSTPLFFIHFLMILTMMLVLKHGVEVLGRMAELSFILIIVLGFLGVISVLMSGKVETENLFPILENGLWGLFSTSFPSLFVVPWGELLAITLLLPYLNKPRSVMKTGLSAVLFSTVVLSFTIMLNILVLGADVFTRSNFALFDTIGRVSLMKFIDRLDPIVLLTLIIGDLFKMGIFFLAAVIGTADLFYVKDYKSLVIPIGIVILLASLTVAGNFAEHVEIGSDMLPLYVHPSISVIIPGLLLFIALIRKRMKRS
ncbi:GerAB/ArcD/ProY family transporter [Halalkalibacter kiskunsagensis]|uniref:GerAB/ArcD/ProY family transporter n=1 Tax=Halalkalibacter kiskunsagensis TaxID=1548599 RepID=A0ABV6K751_9BACI